MEIIQNYSRSIILLKITTLASCFYRVGYKNDRTNYVVCSRHHKMGNKTVACKVNLIVSSEIDSHLLDGIAIVGRIKLRDVKSNNLRYSSLTVLHIFRTTAKSYRG